jgi:hypothetical protein
MRGTITALAAMTTPTPLVLWLLDAGPWGAWLSLAYGAYLALAG